MYIMQKYCLLYLSKVQSFCSLLSCSLIIYQKQKLILFCFVIMFSFSSNFRKIAKNDPLLPLSNDLWYKSECRRPANDAITLFSLTIFASEKICDKTYQEGTFYRPNDVNPFSFDLLPNFRPLYAIFSAPKADKKLL